MRRAAISRQGGAALISVIFLVVVVTSLGAFAMRTSMDQQHIATLSLLEVRADTAAFSGLEYGANILRTTSACPAANPPPIDGIVITVACSAPVVVGTSSVWEITSTARHGAFGNSDYVQRVHIRRVSSIGSGSW